VSTVINDNSPRPCAATAEICKATCLLTMQSERGLLPCVWVIPGRHVSWSEDTCRAAPRSSSSLSHSNAKLEVRHAPLALAPRMIASPEAESIKHTAHTRGYVSASCSLSNDTVVNPRVVYGSLVACVNFISRTIRVPLQGPLSYQQGSYLLQDLLARRAQPRQMRGQWSRTVRLQSCSSRLRSPCISHNKALIARCRVDHTIKSGVQLRIRRIGCTSRRMSALSWSTVHLSGVTTLGYVMAGTRPCIR
jgi:hypothetical protein